MTVKTTYTQDCACGCGYTLRSRIPFTGPSYLPACRFYKAGILNRDNYVAAMKTHGITVA